jgi:hypothetical protein
MNKNKFITILGKIHILAGIFIAIAVVVLPMKYKFFMGEPISVFLTQALPLIILGVGLLALLNSARILLILFHILSFPLGILSSFSYYWIYGIIRTLFALLMLVCLTLPSVKQQIISVNEKDKIKRLSVNEASKNALIIGISIVAILLVLQIISFVMICLLRMFPHPT